MSTEKDKVNTGLLGAIAAILTLSVIGIAFAVTALVRNSEDEQIAEKSVGAAQPVMDLSKQQESELTAPAAWADKAKGTASVPIDRAMALVVDKIKDNPEWATPAPPPKDAGADGDDDAGDAGAEGDAEATDTDAGAESTDDAGAAPTPPEKTEPSTPAPSPPTDAPKTPKPTAPAPPPAPTPTAATPPAPEEPTGP